MVLGSEASDTSHQRGLMEKGMKGNMDVVQLLLKYGAKIDMRDKDGITPLMYVTRIDMFRGLFLYHDVVIFHI